MEPLAASTTQMVTFRVGGESFALRSELIQEVARMPRVTRVPHAPPALLGLANLRGSVIPVLSVARMLDQPGAEPTRIIVIDADERVGLAVDDANQALVGAGQAAGELDVAALVARNMPARMRRSAGGLATAQVSDAGPRTGPK